ncbi:MAG: hypothetical protein JWM80_2041 [Cyanobacteria bacterium RYN_339]|nr:hypothetical protein [Cyanobacteria bacterium RYN_339]
MAFTGALVVVAPGCAADSGLAARLGASFGLARTELAAPVVVPAAAAIAPETRTVTTPVAAPPAPVAPPEPVKVASSSGGGGAVYSSSGGGSVAPAPVETTLTVSLAGFLERFQPLPGHYQLQSVGSNVDHLVIVVHQTGQPDQTQTVLGSSIKYDGTAKVTFTGLADGSSTVEITAYDAAGNVVGNAAQNALVAPGKANQVDTSVNLGHNEILTVTTPLEDGAATGAATPVATGTQLDSYWGGAKLAAGPAGSVIVQTPFFMQQPNIQLSFQYMIRQVNPSGTTTAGVFGGFAGIVASVNDVVYAPASNRVWMCNRNTLYWPLGGDKTLMKFQATGVTAAANGDGLFSTATGVVRVKPDGTQTPTGIPKVATLAADASDAVWATSRATASGPLDASVKKYDQAGTVLATATLPHTPDVLMVDGQGNLWVMDGKFSRGFLPTTPGTALTKIAPDGTVVGTYPVAGRQMAADAAGNVWISGPVLTKVSPTGAVLGTFPIDSAGVAVATDGIIWVTGTKTRKLYKLAP